MCDIIIFWSLNCTCVRILRYDQNISLDVLGTLPLSSLRSLWKILEKFLEMFAFVWPMDNFERIFGNLWKLSKLLILVYCLVYLCIVRIWLKGNSMVSWRKFFFLGWKICFKTREVSYLWLHWPFNIYIVLIVIFNNIVWSICLTTMYSTGEGNPI